VCGVCRVRACECAVCEYAACECAACECAACECVACECAVNVQSACAHMRICVCSLSVCSYTNQLLPYSKTLLIVYLLKIDQLGDLSQSQFGLFQTPKVILSHTHTDIYTHIHTHTQRDTHTQTHTGTHIYTHHLE